MIFFVIGGSIGLAFFCSGLYIFAIKISNQMLALEVEEDEGQERES